jgi:hypothetical protein
MAARMIPAPALARPRPAGAWAALSAALAAEVPPIAGRSGLAVTCAPGAGLGAPACYIPALDLIEVDGTCLGVPPGTVHPASPADRERYPATWGALIHECAHAAHTRWSCPPPAACAWAEAGHLLEESRIEAAQAARRPGDRRWIRAAITQLVLADFTAAGAAPGSPREAGSAAALILARGDTGILEPAETGPVAAAVTSAIGPDRLGRLRATWQAAHAAADTDARTMTRLARRWCRILGIDPDQAPPAPLPGSGAGTSPVGRAVTVAAAAITAAVADDAAPAAPAPDPARAADRAARAAATAAARSVFGPAAPPPARRSAITGTRPPAEGEKAAARHLGRALAAAAARDRIPVRTASATPPGRLRVRAALAADAQRAASAQPAALPFTRVTRRVPPAPRLRLGIACDVSGSMYEYTGPAASAAWILARASASIPGATTATVTYGHHVQPVTFPGRAPARVTEFDARGTYEDFRGAIDALDGALDLSRPGAARLLVLITDGDYKDTQYPDGARRAARLAAAGCGILWLNPPGAPGRPVPGATAVTLTDPAATIAIIARAAAAALQHA